MAQGSQDGANGPGGLNPQMQEQVDVVVRQRLEQAFGSVFGKVLAATQRAAEAAEKQATANKTEGITKALKLEAWKPSSREDELKTWREWSFQLSTWLIAHDEEYEADLESIDVDVAVDHALLDGPAVARSQKLFGVLCNVLRNRPLLIVRAQEKEKNGFECIRLLRREMEPKERSRALAIVRQLAAWTFKEGNLHEQIIAYEDAVKGYESSSGKSYPEDLQIATITSGLKEPLRSQVQLRMTSTTRYADLREWVLHYEAINTPWSSSLPTRPGGRAQDHGPAPMDIDRIKGNKGKDPKGKGKGDKGKKGKGKDGKQDSGKGKWNSQADQWKWNSQGDQWKWNSWKQKDHGNQPKGGKGGKGGGGKGVRQVEEAINLGSSWNSNQSSASTSASAVRTPSTVNQVSTVRFEDLGTRLGTTTSGYDTVIYDMTELDSDPADFSLEGLNIMMVKVAQDPERYSLDSSDGDDEWTYSPEAAEDAQGKQIVEDCTRALTITIRDNGGNEVVIREKFAIAAVNSVILSLGRLLRSGWVLGHGPEGPTIARGGNQVSIWLKRNTLMLTAVVSTILACDAGALPPEAEDAVQQPGWAILPSGLPLLTIHNTKNVSLETSLWEADDWSHMAIFVRKEPAGRKPQPGDVWLHVMSGHTLLFPSGGKTLAEIEPELVDSHDVAVLFHVEELGENLLSNPGDLFREPPADEPMVAPADQQQEEDDGRGVWAERDVAGQGPEEDEHDNMIDDVELSLETPLHVLKELCRRLGVATSGSKAKVLRRLRAQKELLAKQLATEIAKKMFDEAECSPDIPVVAPVLPSARQQALHAVTSQPFAAWCPACVLGRSRQSPHKDKPPPKESQEVKEAERRPVFQIDYFYTFTKERGEEEQQPGGGEGAEETEPASKEEQAAEAEKPDYRDQFGLNLVAGESTSGWITVVPVLAKGSTTLKRVAETLVRTTMQIAGAEDVVLQSDAEPAAKQVVHAVQAHVEDRAKIKLSWIMAHAAFLHNRFFTTCKGLPPYEVVHGRRYRGQLVQFGECCVGFCPTKYKGDLQWRKGVWAGINEKNGSHILLSDTGAFETRSLRRLPEEGQWVAEQIVTAKGLPWDYGGSARRKRALYTSRAPVLPDSTTLEELAKAAGRAAAETIAAATPRPAGPDEAGSEASCADEWLDEVGESLWEEAEPEDLESEVLHDGEKPPEVTPEELLKLDLASDRHGVERLMQMGAIRRPKASEDLSSYSRLTTKVVRDSGQRGSDDRAQVLGLELTTLDVKDAYLNVPQKAPVVIEIDSRVFEEGPSRMVPFVLERLLPGQRVAAGEWFGFITGILKEAGLESFPKEPTLFRGAKEGDMTSLVLHADDGLLASTPEARAHLKAKLEEKVVVQFSKPALQIGDEFEFLKRRYVLEQDGVVMFSNNKHLEGLVKALGAQPDVQFATCALASSMAKPTTGAMKKLCRTVGYLANVPVLGFLIKPVQDRACLGKPSGVALQPGGVIILESVTDADWGGNKADRRSKTSAQIYLGGSLLSSFVRSQRSVALSSGESEFIATVAGAGEMLYVKECMEFILKGYATIEATARTDSAASRGISQRIGCGRIRHLDCGLLWLQDSVKKGLLRVGPIAGARNPADVGTKPLCGPKLRELLWRSGAMTDSGECYGEQEGQEADHKQQVNSLVARSGLGTRLGRQTLPVLLVLAQIIAGDGYGGFEGLGLVTASSFLEEFVIATTSAMTMWLVIMIFMVSFPLCVGWAARSLWRAWWHSSPSTEPEPEVCFDEPNVKDKCVQASLGPSPSEKRWQEEYVERCNFLKTALHEEHQTVLGCESELRRLRAEVRRLEAAGPQEVDRWLSTFAVECGRSPRLGKVR
ncbi:unnamed protein product, partial [Symbiodinium necroappetens]